MKSLLAALALCLVALLPVRADDLDIIAAYGTTPDEFGGAYQRLMQADFPTIAGKLARLVGAQIYLSGIGPSTSEPWREPGFPHGDKVGFALQKVWHAHMAKVGRQTETYALMLRLLEDRSIGSGRRTLVFGPLVSALSLPEPLPPLLAELRPRLRKVASDPAETPDFRRRLVTALAMHDANFTIDLAIQAAEAQESPLRRAEAFREIVPVSQAEKLTPATRAKFFRYGFSLVEALDDGQGAAYFIANHLGIYIRCIPGREKEGFFTPDPQKKQFRPRPGEKGPPKVYYQETVDNAFRWWKANQTAFPDCEYRAKLRLILP